MRRRILFAAVLLVNFSYLKAQLLKTDEGIVLKNFGSNTHTLSLEIISHNIIHVTASPTVYYSDTLSPKFNSGQSPFSIKINNEEIILKTESLQACVNPNTGKITFKDKSNYIILQESNRIYKQSKETTEHFWSVTQEFKWETAEILYTYDLGNGQNTNVTGKLLEFTQPGSPYQYPLISSSKGYGLLWLNNSSSKFCNNNRSYLWAEKTSQIEYYFLYAPSTNEFWNDYNKLTTALTEASKNSLGYFSTPLPDQD